MYSSAWNSIGILVSAEFKFYCFGLYIEGIQSRRDMELPGLNRFIKGFQAVFKQS